MTPIMTLAVHI